VKLGLNLEPATADAQRVTDRVVLTPDTLRLLQHAAVITDAAGQLDTSQGWDRDELLDTIEMHSRAVRVEVSSYR
jgi:hypothetical protein